MVSIIVSLLISVVARACRFLLMFTDRSVKDRLRKLTVDNAVRSDSGCMAGNSGDGTLESALDEGVFALAWVFGGASGEGAFPLTRDLGEGDLGASGSEDIVTTPNFALDFLGLAG